MKTPASAAQVSPCPLIASVTHLVNSGHPAQAIEAVEQGCANQSLALDHRLELLHLRAECHQMRLEIPEHLACLQTIVAAAEAASQPTIQFFGALAKANQQARAMDFPAAVQSAKAALAAAKRSGQDRLRCWALARLGLALLQCGDLSEHVLAVSREAISLAESLGDARLVAMILPLEHRWLSNTGRTAEADRVAERLLALGRHQSLPGAEGEALNLLTFHTSDPSTTFPLYRQSLAAFEAAGNVARRANVMNNLASSYLEVGLFQHAIRIGRDALPSLLKVGIPENVAAAFLNIFHSEWALRENGWLPEEYSDGSKHWQALPSGMAKSMPKGLWHFTGLGYFINGRELLLQNQPEQAARLLEKAAKAYAGQDPGFCIHALNWATRAYLNAGCLSEALAVAQRAEKRRRDHGLANLNNFYPIFHWWTCSQALAANGRRAKAEEALAMAWRAVLATANGLGDEGLRRNFLNKPSDSRDIVRAWVHQARQRNMPAAEYECHLTGQTSSKEPYQRMVDAGLRMGEIHTEEALCQFLVEELTELTGAERVLVLFQDGTRQRVAAALLPGDEMQAALLEAIEPWLVEAASTRAARLRHGPHDVAAIDQRSCLVVPMVAQRELLGLVYLDIDGLYGRLHEGDTQMVSVIGAQAAMALANVRAAAALEEKVSQRTAEVQAQYQQRAAEIAIINSVQTTLTAEMDLQGIYDAAGDKLREIFAGRDVIIRVFDHATQTIHTPYGYEGGSRLAIPPQPIVDYGYTAHILRTRESIVINEKIAEATARYGGYTVEGTAIEKAVAIVPLLTPEQVLGLIYIVDLEREHAFSESDIRLLETLANAMTVGLENARLFDETQRLFKETKQSAAEMAIINRIQQGIAGSLDFQSIVNLVGDQLREVLQADNIGIRWLDHERQTGHYLYEVEHGIHINIAPGVLDVADCVEAPPAARPGRRRRCGPLPESLSRGHA